MQTTTRILALLLAFVGIARAALPTIDTQPANSTNCVGTAASFTVAASSDSTTNYQWYFADNTSTNLITDATNATYSIASVAPANAGGYFAVVTNFDGSVTSVVATLTVNALPSVSVNNASICPGGTATLTATTGASSPSYLWSPGGATTASIMVSPGATTTYTVLVTDGVTGCTNGASGTVTVNSQPSVSVNNATICVGGSATLTATTGASSPSYLWSPGGATTASIIVSPGSTTVYTVLVTDGVTGCTNSASGTVTVNPLPSVSVNSVTVCSNTAGVLTATTGAASPSYLWTPGGQTTASVTNTPTTTTVYTVRVTDGVTGCTNSASGTITVQTNTTATALVNSTNCPGSSATFTTTAGGTGPFTYQWTSNGVDIAGATANSYTVVNINAGSAATYCVKVTGACNTVTNCATLTVVSTPTITLGPIAPGIAPAMGNGVVFRVTASSATPSVALTYQWKTNGVDVANSTNITGATTTTLTISNLPFALNGVQVSVAVSNCAGGLVSSPATLSVRAIHGISFDFNTPGQYTNVPYNLDPNLNNWVVFNAASTTIGAQGTAMGVPGGGGAQGQAFEVSTGGVGVATGSGAIDFIFNNGLDHHHMLLPLTYDFSRTGIVLTASVTVKLKNPTAANSRTVEWGFLTVSNEFSATENKKFNNQWQGLNGNDRAGWIAAIFQSTAAANANYHLRAQNKALIGGTTTSELIPINSPTNTLNTNGWYKLVAQFMNQSGPGTNASNYTVYVTCQDMGANGITPGAIMLAFTNPILQQAADMVKQTNCYFVMRFGNGDTSGADYYDNVFVTTVSGPIFFVAPVISPSVTEGQRVTFKAMVDGDGPYTYQWFKNGTAIPGAGDWKYVTPPLPTGDNGAQYSVTVSSTNNTISSTGTVTVTSAALAVVSVGSVDGGVIGVRFNKPVDPATATVAGNYLVNGVAAVGAQMRRDQTDAHNAANGIVNGQEVLITPASVVTTPYTVAVSGVTTISGTALGASNSSTGRVENLTGYDVDANSVGFFASSILEVTANGAVGTYPGDNYSFAPGQFEITAGGEDIFSTKDGFRFVYTQMTGDFDIKMRAIYEDIIRTPTKIGFNARISLDAFAPNVGMYADPQPPGRDFIEGGARYVWGGGGNSWGTNTACNWPNTWLRLRRVGNTFIRYSSKDGVNWLCDGQVSPMSQTAPGSFLWPDTLYVGLAANCNVGSGAPQIPNRAISDSYGPFAGYSGVNIGITTQPANQTVAAGSAATFTIVAIATNAPQNGQAGEIAYVWQRTNSLAGGWTNMPNAGVTNAVFTTPNTLFGSDNGAFFRAILKVAGGASITSAVAQVTVTDAALPTVATTSIGTPSNSFDRVFVTFSEYVSAATALNKANYLLTNSAGTVFGIANIAFNWTAGDQRQVIITTSNALPTDFYGLVISGVQDLGVPPNTIATVTRTFRQVSSYPFAGPVEMDVYQGLATGGSPPIADLTNNVRFIVNSPDYIQYSNVMGFNHQTITSQTGPQDNYGVRMFAYFVPTQSLQYTFWFRGDDYAIFSMNTNNTADSTNRNNRVFSNPMNVNTPFYALTNTFTTPVLNVGQKYYIEFCYKETGGGDGGGVMVTTGTTNGLTGGPAMVGGITNVLASDLLMFPSEWANYPKVMVEQYTNQLYTGYNLFPSQIVAANGNKSELVLSTNTLRYVAGIPDMFGYEKHSGMYTNLAQSGGDNYLGKLYTYFIPPSSGDYKFWFRADDACQLWMNTNTVNSTDPAGKNLVGEVPAYFGATTYFSNGIVRGLIGGQRYYLEGLWREGTGGDGMSVAVRSASDVNVPPFTEVIPSSQLEFPTNLNRLGPVNFNGAGSKPGVTPYNPTVTEGTVLTFFPQGVCGAQPYFFFWMKNGVAVEAAPPINGGNGFFTAPFYRTLPLTLADNGAVYALVVSNNFSVVTQLTTVTVTADSTAPTIVSAVGSQFNTYCVVTFNEALDPTTAGQLSNYRINGGVTVLSATFDPVARNRVSLRTTLQSPGTQYTLTVNGVRDASQAGNAIVNATKTFTSWGFGGLGTVYVEWWTNQLGTAFQALLNDPRYVNNEPDGSYYTNVFDAGQFGAETGRNFWAARVTGLFMPPSNGLYRFYLRSDDSSMLFMNTNGPDANGAVVVARSLAANPAAYDNGNSENGAAITGGSVLAASFTPVISLTNGTAYFLQAVFKEGTGGDYVAVIFRAIGSDGLPVGGLPTPAAGDGIAGGFFKTTGNPDINQFLVTQSPPTELFLVENDPVNLVFAATTIPPSLTPYISYQWQRSNSLSGTFTNIPGATASTLSFYAATNDDGITYRLIASIPGTTLTLPTLLHVVEDTNPPNMLSVSSIDGYTVGVAFDEPVDLSTAQETSNWSVDSYAVDVLTATVLPSDPRKVILALTLNGNPAAISGDILVENFGIRDRAAGIHEGAPGNINFYTYATGAVQNVLTQMVGTASGNVAGGYNSLVPSSSFTFTNGGFDVSANGFDIWNTADAFQYTYRQVSGNFDIKVRVQNFIGADQWSKAGLMVRPSTNSNSRMFFMCATPQLTPIAGQTPNNFFAAQYRDTDGGSPGNVQNNVPANIAPGPLANPNAWVRLQRSNSVFYGFWSTNGTDWGVLTARDTATNAGGAFPDTVLVGMGTTSHDQTRALANNAIVEYRNLYFPVGATITSQPGPSPVTVGIHQSVSFTGLTASGDNVHYQWRLNGAAIADATNANYTIANTAVAHSGLYSVAVFNDGGGQISSNLQLTVTNVLPVANSDSITVTQSLARTFPTTVLTANDTDFELDPVSVLAVFTPHTIATNFDQGLLAGMTLFGPTTNAYWTNQTGVTNSGALHLHNAVNNAAGSAIISPLTPGARVLAFTANFKLRIADSTTPAEPADGFSFNFASDLPNDGSAPNAAEQGVGTGFSFCVDNYRFAPLNVGGTANNPGGGTANTSGIKIQYNNIILAGIQTPVWNNANYIPISVTIDTAGNLTVMVDGTNAFTRVIPWVPTAGRFGFYSRTGGANQATWIDDLDIRLIEEDSVRGGLVSLSGGNVTYTPPANACGSDTFYYLASDGQLGGTNVGTVNVTILATNAPLIVTCATNQTVSVGGSCTATLADLRSQLVVVDCDGTTITQNPAPGSSIPLGSTVVTFGVTNNAGLGTTCQATITAVDVTPPVAICPANISTPATSQSGAVVTFSISGTDNCTVSSVVANPASGSTFPPGTNTVTVTATDSSGNTNACTFLVIVTQDATPPVIDCPTNRTVVCSGTNAIATYTATATDNVDPNPTVIVSPPSGSNFPVGTNTVLVTAYDSSGNTNTCMFLVIVTDPLADNISLTIQESSTNVVITWPQTCTSYTLEKSANLNSPTNWMPASLPVVPVGNNFQATAPANATDRYYRLHKN